MVAAKLDQSRVLVTKFRQNRFTLKGSLRLNATIGDDRREVAGMADFKMYLLLQLCSNRVDFLQYTGDTVKKMMDQNFEIRFM